MKCPGWGGLSPSLCSFHFTTVVTEVTQWVRSLQEKEKNQERLTSEHSRTLLLSWTVSPLKYLSCNPNQQYLKIWPHLKIVFIKVTKEKNSIKMSPRTIWNLDRNKHTQRWHYQDTQEDHPRPEAKQSQVLQEAKILH